MKQVLMVVPLGLAENDGKTPNKVVEKIDLKIVFLRTININRGIPHFADKHRYRREILVQTSI